LLSDERFIGPQLKGRRTPRAKILPASLDFDIKKLKKYINRLPQKNVQIP